MCEEQKQAIKFSCEGNSTKIHNSFVLFFCVSSGKLMLTIHYIPHSSPIFTSYYMLALTFRYFLFFALAMIKFYGLFSFFCCEADTRNVPSRFLFLSLFPHFSSAVTKSTWLLTYRLVVKFFMNNTIEVCVCVPKHLTNCENANELLSSGVSSGNLVSHCFVSVESCIFAHKMAQK